jgi:hypothetical protein
MQKLNLPHSTFNGDELPPPKIEHVSRDKSPNNLNLSVEDITEEALDDWIA